MQQLIKISIKILFTEKGNSDNPAILRISFVKENTNKITIE
jgi:hypothetical protein